jgi:hypothetical protein
VSEFLQVSQAELTQALQVESRLVLQAELTQVLLAE